MSLTHGMRSSASAAPRCADAAGASKFEAEPCCILNVAGVSVARTKDNDWIDATALLDASTEANRAF